MGVLTLTPSQAAAARGAGGGCAACARMAGGLPPKPVRRQPVPALYQFTIHEFTNYDALHDVRAGQALSAARWRDVESTSTVYLFKTLHGITTVKPFPAARQISLKVTEADAGAEYTFVLSRFPLPAARLKEYQAPNGLSMLRDRGIRLVPGYETPHHVKQRSGTAYDVVLTDYRHMATDLLAAEAQQRLKYERFQQDATEAPKRTLALWTLNTASALAKQRADTGKGDDPWACLRPGSPSGWPHAGIRLPGYERFAADRGGALPREAGGAAAVTSGRGRQDSEAALRVDARASVHRDAL